MWTSVYYLSEACDNGHWNDCLPLSFSCQWASRLIWNSHGNMCTQSVSGQSCWFNCSFFAVIRDEGIKGYFYLNKNFIMLFIVFASCRSNNGCLLPLYQWFYLFTDWRVHSEDAMPSAWSSSEFSFVPEPWHCTRQVPEPWRGQQGNCKFKFHNRMF